LLTNSTANGAPGLSPDTPVGHGSDRLLLTARDAAFALAISERTLWSLTRLGLIPVVRLGRSVRYDRADLQRFIDAQKCNARK
jgi:excisionase family DNA binding protein